MSAVCSPLVSTIWPCLKCRRRVIVVGVTLLMAVTCFAVFFQGVIVKGTLDQLRLASKKRTEGTMLAAAPGEDAEDVGEVFEERRKRYLRVCRAWQDSSGTKVPGGVRNPFFYPPANFSVCGVPKVGATFWKRVFFFLFNRTRSRQAEGQASSPMDVDRRFVHTHSAGRGARVHVGQPEDWARLSATRRVLFSRDPWSRLWSAYVDKYVMPDSWMDHGLKIVSMRNSLPAQEAITLRKQSELERQLTRNENTSRTLTTAVDKTKCADDITFAEFLRYAAINKNAHWSPVHGVCNPCVYQPQFLGKMETFSRDIAYILNTVGLSDTLKLPMTHSHHVLDELEQLTNYHYQHFKGLHRKFENCLDFLGVARRLWRAFQLNGYIPAHVEFPAHLLEREISPLTEEEAVMHVVKTMQHAHLARPLGAAEWAMLKRMNMVAAYRSVPTQLLQEMQNKFQLDFELFQYDKQPADIFGQVVPI